MQSNQQPTQLNDHYTNSNDNNNFNEPTTTSHVPVPVSTIPAPKPLHNNSNSPVLQSIVEQEELASSFMQSDNDSDTESYNEIRQVREVV